MMRAFKSSTVARGIGYDILLEKISVQEKKFTINFQDGGHLGFPIRF